MDKAKYLDKSWLEFIWLMPVRCSFNQWALYCYRHKC